MLCIFFSGLGLLLKIVQVGGWQWLVLGLIGIVVDSLVLQSSSSMYFPLCLCSHLTAEQINVVLCTITNYR